MNTQEQAKKDAWAYLNALVKAYRLSRKTFASLNAAGIKILSNQLENGYIRIQMYGLKQWCELLEMPYFGTDWDGNKSCGSNYDEIYFIYKGCKFFDLVEKEVFDLVEKEGR